MSKQQPIRIEAKPGGKSIESMPTDVRGVSIYRFPWVNDPRGEAYQVMLRLNLPPSYLLIHRTWVGGVGVLSQLGARIPFREILLESLPGFAEESA